MSKKKTAYLDGSSKIIRLFYETYNKYGYGFDRELYVNALETAFRQDQIKRIKNKKIQVKYGEEIIGEFQIDFVISNELLIYVTNDDELLDKEVLRLFNYVKSSPYKTGLLLNFGIKPEHRRRESEY